jgi:hypothetical protein
VTVRGALVTGTEVRGRLGRLGTRGLRSVMLAEVNNQTRGKSPVCGSGEVVCSLSLLIRWAQRAAIRQKLHLSSCSDFRDQL